MSEMIERVAESICNKRQQLRYRGAITTKWRAPEMDQGYISDCLEMAKAAIEAMRKPTKAMIEAHDDYPFMPEAMSRMIDTALKEKSPATS